MLLSEETVLMARKDIPNIHAVLQFNSLILEEAELVDELARLGILPKDRLDDADIAIYNFNGVSLPQLFAEAERVKNVAPELYAEIMQVKNDFGKEW